MSDYIYPPPSTLPPGSPVIAYIRDSGGPNQQESIGQQTREIQDHCKTHGLILTRVYAETASGRKTKNRKQFLAMYEELMNCPVNIRPRGLILWSFSRFSRDMTDFYYYMSGLIKMGLIIHSLTEQIPDGLTGQIMLALKAYNNADFSVQLGKNIKRGITDKVKAGYNNGGQPPKGYNIVREYQESKRTNGVERIGIKWQPDPILAPLVRLAWELRAKGKSYSEITRATEGKIYTSNNAWVTHFRNESYLGIGKAGEERFPDHHEPLITWELWEAVREIEAVNRKRQHYQRVKYPYLLAGLAQCIYCGASMVVHTSDGYRCYICGMRDRKKGFANCPNSRRVNAPKFESLILDTVLNRILSPEFASQILLDVQNEMTDREKIDREIGEANNALVHVERKITRLLKLVEDAGEIDEVKPRLGELKRQQAEYKIQIRELKVKQEQEITKLTPEALALVFDHWREQIKTAVDRGEIITARKLLSMFVSKIELAYNKAVIYYTYPMSTATDAEQLCAHLFYRRVTHKVEINLE